MTISFHLPAELEERLGRGLDLNVEAREAFLVDLYRRGLLSLPALARALGGDRMRAEEILHKHHVTEDLGTLEDYLADAAALERLRQTGR